MSLANEFDANEIDELRLVGDHFRRWGGRSSENGILAVPSLVLPSYRYMAAVGAKWAMHILQVG